MLLAVAGLLLASVSARPLHGARRKGRPWLEMMGWAMGMAGLDHAAMSASLSCLYRYKDRCKVARWGCWR